MEVAGVDGCRGGWLATRCDASGRLCLLEVLVAPTFRDLIEATSRCEAVAVDIPIGLSDGDPREADVAARKVLGPRASSVFPTPIRPVLHARTYEEACAISVQATGKKITKQTFAIAPKVREADAGMTPDLQRRLVEVHPEVCFWKLNGEQPMRHKKKEREGAAERAEALARTFETDLGSVTLPGGAARDDLFDACAAAWTAGRVAYGTAVRRPAQPPLDARGLRMEIVY